MRCEVARIGVLGDEAVARRERAAGTTNHQHACVTIGFGVLGCSQNLPDRTRRQRIVLFGPIQGDSANASDLFDHEGGECRRHVALLRSRSDTSCALSTLPASFRGRASTTVMRLGTL